ncbi:MAG: DUF4019 domain-containing protein [Gammaproteobacteria bacterium]|nr:DUF4019 domain-containing protein [Gammaproteobacteria bacterium]
MLLVCHKTILCLLMLLLPLAGQASEAKIRAARKAVTEWLALVDQQQYQESWNQAASLFRQQVDAAVWSQQLSGARKPLGNVTNRVQMNAAYSTSLPGAPDGEYVVFQFKTEFTNKKNAVETVTPMLDGKRWRVAGYYVR